MLFVCCILALRSLKCYHKSNPLKYVESLILSETEATVGLCKLLVFRGDSSPYKAQVTLSLLSETLQARHYETGLCSAGQILSSSEQLIRKAASTRQRKLELVCIMAYCLLRSSSICTGNDDRSMLTAPSHSWLLRLSKHMIPATKAWLQARFGFTAITPTADLLINALKVNNEQNSQESQLTVSVIN